MKTYTFKYQTRRTDSLIFVSAESKKEAIKEVEASLDYTDISNLMGEVGKDGDPVLYC